VPVDAGGAGAAKEVKELASRVAMRLRRRAGAPPVQRHGECRHARVLEVRSIRIHQRRAAGLGAHRLHFSLVRVEEGGVHRLHQRNVEHVEPDHRLGAAVLMVVPGPGWREDEVALVHGEALAFDGGGGAAAFHDEAQGVRGMAVRFGHLAGKDHLDGAPEGGRGACGKPGVGEAQRAALAARADVHLAPDALEQRLELTPAPVHRRHRRARLAREERRVVGLVHPAVEPLEVALERAAGIGVTHAVSSRPTLP
jgi:hypothetical protein